jgi:hypothetical protein
MFIALLTMMAVPSFDSGRSLHPQFTAQAGHTITNGWCECGEPSCICEPGELAGARNLTPQPILAPAGGSEALGGLLLALVLLRLLMR